MASKRDNDTRLVATRVSPEAFDVLQIALLAEGAESMQELLRPIVEEYAEKLAREPEVRAIMDSVEDYRARKAGVRRLRGSRPSRGEASDPESSTNADES